MSMHEITPRSPRRAGPPAADKPAPEGATPGDTPATGPLAIEAYGLTDAGRLREDNQDAFLIAPESGTVIVADGLGGSAGGALASRLAVETIAAVFTRPNVAPLLARGRRTDPAALPIVLEGAITEAHWRLSAEATETGLLHMATTITVLVLGAHHVAIAHLGDSRVHRIRRGAIRRLTRDDSLLQAYLDRHGTATPEVTAQCAHVLTKALSARRELVSPTVQIEPRQPGDLFLVSTDGLTNLVEEDHILSLVENASTLQTGVEQLVAAALEAGGYDNVTAVLARLAPEEET